jgi:hypothetical protein
LYSDSSTDRAVTKLRLGEIWIETGDKEAMPANITAGYRANGDDHINPSVIPDAIFAPSLLTHSEDAQDCNLRQRLRRQLLLFCYSKRLGRLVLCLLHLATLCQPTVMMIRWLTVQQSVIK